MAGRGEARLVEFGLVSPGKRLSGKGYRPVKSVDRMIEIRNR
jgi:hypothetical protein